MAEHGSDSADLTASILAGSDMVYDLFCEVCADFDKHLEAKGFCIDCFEYLCGDCVKVHGTHRLSRNHVVQTKSQMPSQKPQQKQSKDMDRGQPHRLPHGQMNRGTASSNPQDIVGPTTNNRNQYEFPVGRVKVLVYKQSITDIKNMDAVVNAANERMAHGGGIAFYISKAAGSAMDMECNMYVKKNGPLQASEVYTSKPGKMKCKGILHAVGPRWSEYIGKEDQCARDLYTTVYRCLKTMEGHRWRNMALCAISSGIFGVPKPLCTAMYLKAIEDFATKHPTTYMEVHFIDVVQEILDQMIQTHKERVQRGFSPGFDVAFKFPSAKQDSATQIRPT